MPSIVEGISAVVCVQATSKGPTNAIGQDFTVSLESADMTAGEKMYMYLKYSIIHVVDGHFFTHLSGGNGLFRPHPF